MDLGLQGKRADRRGGLGSSAAPHPKSFANLKQAKPIIGELSSVFWELRQFFHP
jgi:hypothetical protein